jgi:uncharacterized RDD family membrane protein YckC
MDPDNNPYAAPVSAPAEPLPVPRLDVFANPATAGLRFANFIIDRIVGVLLMVVFGFFYGLVMGAEEGESNGVFVVATVGANLLYYVVMEASCGRTVGKFVTGTRVVNERGEHPSWLQAIGRTLCRFIPFEPFSFLGSTARGWHDAIPRTWVVRSR